MQRGKKSIRMRTHRPHIYKIYMSAAASASADAAADIGSQAICPYTYSWRVSALVATYRPNILV